MEKPYQYRKTIPKRNIKNSKQNFKKSITMNTEITKYQEVKTKVHFTENTLINPTNPVTVNLIGAGGTGSQVLTALARMNHALTQIPQ